MVGHIKLGTTAATLRDYMLVEFRQYVRSNANQLAAKIGTGAGDYSDLESWTAWVMDDWQAGTGKTDPTAGGFLYAEAETRWPKRITMPAALLAATQQDETNYALNFETGPGHLKGESSITIGAGQAITRISKAIKGNGTKLRGALFMTTPNPNIFAEDTVTRIAVELWTSTGSPARPNTLVELIDPIDIDDGLPIHFVEFDSNTVDGTTYHLVIYPPEGTLTLPIDISSDDPAADLVSTYNGTTWTGGYTGGRPLIAPCLGQPLAEVSHICYFPANGYMYAAADAGLWRRTADTANWTLLNTFAANISDLHTDGSTLYIALGDGTNYRTMNSGEVLTTASVAARLFTRYNGYLWRAVANMVSYTSDGVTWSSTIEVCPSGFIVNAMAGHGDYLHVATDDGLRYVGVADVVLNATEWNQLDLADSAGKNMLAWQGALYIPLGQSIVRYDAGSVLPVGPDLGEGLPIDKSGDVVDMAAQNNWLFCAVQGRAGQSTVWAYNGQGWHNVAVSPASDTLYFTCMHYRRDQRRLYLGTNQGTIFHVTVPDSPSMSDSNAFPFTSPYGWVETDWMYGGLKDVNKDWESVYVSADFVDEQHPIRIYWQDEGSGNNWEYLGEITADGQELRWEDYTERPNSKRLKLALGMYAKQSIFGDGGPEVRAIRVKYHNMTKDTYRWNLPIQVSDEQMLLDNQNPYSAVDMKAHLDGLVTQVPPLLFEDLDGTQYECKVVDCTVVPDKVEYINGSKRSSFIYRLTIEQVVHGA